MMHYALTWPRQERATKLQHCRLPTEHRSAGENQNNHRMPRVSPLTERLLPFHAFSLQAVYLSPSVRLRRSQRLALHAEMRREVENQAHDLQRAVAWT